MESDSVAPIVGSVLGILVLFCLIQIVGTPIQPFGTEGESILYSILVYVPVIVVCFLALLRSRKRARPEQQVL